VQTKTLKAKIILSLLILLLVSVFVVSGCSNKIANKEATGSQKIVITDLSGRQVNVPVPAQKVVAIGPGALRLVCYVNGVGKVVGVENAEKQWPTIQ